MSEDLYRFVTPHDIDDLKMLFGANIDRLLPKYEDIPDEFKHGPANKWVRFQQDWFFSGLPKNTTVKLQEGINGRTAFRHLKAIQGSYEPSHEHKEAAVAYLASLWFKDVKYKIDK